MGHLIKKEGKLPNITKTENFIKSRLPNKILNNNTEIGKILNKQNGKYPKTREGSNYMCPYR